MFDASARDAWQVQVTIVSQCCLATMAGSETRLKYNLICSSHVSKPHSLISNSDGSLRLHLGARSRNKKENTSKLEVAVQQSDILSGNPVQQLPEFHLGALFLKD